MLMGFPLGKCAVGFRGCKVAQYSTRAGCCAAATGTARGLGLISVNYFRIGVFLCGQNLFQHK